MCFLYSYGEGQKKKCAPPKWRWRGHGVWPRVTALKWRHKSVGYSSYSHTRDVGWGGWDRGWGCSRDEEKLGVKITRLPCGGVCVVCVLACASGEELKDTNLQLSVFLSSVFVWVLTPKANNRPLYSVQVEHTRTRMPRTERSKTVSGLHTHARTVAHSVCLLSAWPASTFGLHPIMREGNPFLDSIQAIDPQYWFFPIWIKVFFSLHAQCKDSSLKVY